MRTSQTFSVCGAGRWFSADPVVLRSTVEGYMDQAVVSPIAGALLGGIAPHAGMGYSGRVAGHTYAALRADARRQGSPGRAIVLGFSHRPAVPGLALLDADAIRTPLGVLPVDRSGVDWLLRAVPGARLDCAPHIGEHSAENQLPFLQCALPEVPVIVGLVCGHDAALFASIGAALLQLHAQARHVCVASTDLLHDASYARVCETDADTLSLLEKLDFGGLNKAWSPAWQVCCGIGPVLSMLSFVQSAGCRRGTLLFSENSGDVDPAGRGHWVVGYGAVVFSARENET